jgi:hypothetical protein
MAAMSGGSHQGRPAGVLLDAPAAPATTLAAIGHHPRVAQLARHAMRAAPPLAAKHQPAADARADGYQGHRVRHVPRRAVPELGPCSHVPVVLHHHRAEGIDAVDGGEEGAVTTTAADAADC